METEGHQCFIIETGHNYSHVYLKMNSSDNNIITIETEVHQCFIIETWHNYSHVYLKINSSPLNFE